MRFTNCGRRASKTALIILVTCLIPASTTADTPPAPTFNQDVAAIIYKHCAICHREGEIGPFPLTSYEEVRKRAAMVRHVTGTRYMPPYKPDPTYTTFVGERWLREDELQTLDRWVRGGAPEGTAAPPNWQDFLPKDDLGAPDLVVGMDRSYVIPGNNRDHFRTFVVPLDLESDIELAALRFRPGNPRIVHHAMIYVDTTGAALEVERQTPGYGFDSWDGMKLQISDILPPYVPGREPVIYPPRSGKRLSKDALLLLNMHYAPTPREESDQSYVELFFADEPLRYEIVPHAIRERDLLQEALFIPAGQTRRFEQRRTFDEELEIVSIYPHMHYRGKSLLAYAQPPNGTETVPLLKIDDWDFNWQGNYTFPSPVMLPAGSTIHFHALFDNTAENPANPMVPPVDARRGRRSQDEMMILGFETRRRIESPTTPNPQPQENQLTTLPASAPAKPPASTESTRPGPAKRRASLAPVVGSVLAVLVAVAVVLAIRLQAAATRT